jgi:DNA-directed RNA polymerase subunit L
MNNSARSPREKRAIRKELAEILHRLVRCSENPERLIELYYWTAEHEIIEIIRQYISLPDEPKKALRAFLSMTSDCTDSVRVNVNKEGHVTFSSPVVTKLMKTMGRVPVRDQKLESVQ